MRETEVKSEIPDYMIRWPEIVDPATCSAEIDDQNLTISIRKAEPCRTRARKVRRASNGVQAVAFKYSVSDS
jgi:hypothetical protein